MTPLRRPPFTLKPQHIAYLKMVTDHQVALFCFIRSVAPGLGDADDVLQETNIVLWKKMGDFEAGTNFKAFAFRIAYLKTMEALRKRTRGACLPLDETVSALIAESWESAPAPGLPTVGALEQCLEHLDEESRRLIDLRYAAGRTVRTLAAEMRSAEGALQQKFFRIRRALRECIEKRTAEESR